MASHPHSQQEIKKKHSDCSSASCSTASPSPPPTTIALNPDASAAVETTLNVAGMDCADEVEALQRVLRPLPGVREIKVNLMAGRVTLAHDRTVTPDSLIATIGKAGLKASIPDSHTSPEFASASAQRHRVIAVAISGFFTGVGFLFQFLDLPSLRIASFALAVISGAWFIAPKALRAARQRSLDMNVLMTVAVTGAMLIGEWSEAAAVTFLFALSEALEAFSLNRARRAIQSLLKLAPDTALLKRGSSTEEVTVQQVAIGDTILVRSGAKIPLDGEVTSGESSVNQAPITGESMPVSKGKGDVVYAGTLNEHGSLEVKVTKLFSDTTLAKIIDLVEEAQSTKAPSQQFVDRFARIYTPAVFLLAIAALLVPPLLFSAPWDTWIYRSLVFLVIACPCALVISTPVSIVSGLTAMARHGVLIKGGTFLESVGRLKALAVDKTGTITEGKPRVQRIHPLGSSTRDDVLRAAAAIDAHSDHPLARAVLDAAAENQVQVPTSTAYENRTGRGAVAIIDGDPHFVGNHRFAHELGLCTPDLEKLLADIESQALSVVVVGYLPHDAEKGSVLGVLSVGDAIRSNARQAIEAIHRSGVEKIVMLSGDNQRTVDAISKQVGIDQAKGDLLPDDKIRHIKELVASHMFVGMIGDGVNDAPAMAAATIGIAMGQAGTDTAIETADIALMQDDLSKVAAAVSLGRRTLRVIQMNIAFALAVKAVFLLLAFFGYTSLWLAILADTGATLVVIANALRLLKST